MNASETVQFALTTALVFITGYYAWQNQRMVGEMRETRMLSVLPSLVVELKFMGAGFGVVAVKNVGLGPALDVNVTLTFERHDGPPKDIRRWRKNVVTPGEEHRFYGMDLSGKVIGVDKLVLLYSRISLSGTCRDSLGTTRQVDAAVTDLAELWELTKSSSHALQEDPNEKAAKEIEKIGKTLNVIAKNLK